MEFMRKNYTGILVCFGIAVPAWLLGKAFPIIGGPVLSILFGMLIALFWSDKGKAAAGIKWTSKIILQTAVVLLGFGLNLGVIFETGKQSLPIIVCTIGISLLLAWALHKALRVPSDTAILVGVGSSICGARRSRQPLRSSAQTTTRWRSPSRSFSSLMCLRQFSFRCWEARLDLTRAREMRSVSLRERQLTIHHR